MKQKNPHVGGIQMPMFTPASDWTPPTELPDWRRCGTISLDSETRDEGLAADMGSSWVTRGGHICGVGMAARVDGVIQGVYAPIQHPDTDCLDKDAVRRWVQDHIDAGCQIVTQGGLYDWGWFRTDLGVRMPPSDQLEEVGALATMVDENRYEYNLDALCRWRNLPGKDNALLHEAAATYGFGTTERSIKSNLWRLPGRYVGPYGLADPMQTLALWEDLVPILSQEGTEEAYRLEVDLLPLAHEMRFRGIRVDLDAAERARDRLFVMRDAVFTELSERTSESVGMEEIGRNKWMERMFATHAPEIRVPRTAPSKNFPDGQASFTAGSTGWMQKERHWLPRLVVKADKYNNAAVKFIQGYIIDHSRRGRIHAEIHLHRSDDGGTRSLRLSYSDPPLQQMTSRDDELTPMIRGVFLPEPGEVWCKPDVSQQEYRFIVHYATLKGLPKALEAAQMYRENPKTDFHDLVTRLTNPGVDFDNISKEDFTRLRRPAKDTNFAKAFGAGIPKFAAMINKTEEEAEAIYKQYDDNMPFVQRLFEYCESLAQRRGYITLYDGARRHWTDWEPKYLSSGERRRGYEEKWPMNSCAKAEALERTVTEGHPWAGKSLRRAEVRKAMNGLIQGSAARHTKLWMRACWREGVVPLLQLHDELDVSVANPETAELVARLGREAVELLVPMQVDPAYGRNWADAKHDEWSEDLRAA